MSTKYSSAHERFYKEFISRQRILFTPEDQEKIRRAVFVIAGLGANGGPAAIALVRMGAEHIKLIDHDMVEISNLNRQPYFLMDVGTYKVDALKRYLKAINPFADVTIFREKLSKNNVDKVLKDAHVVIDAMDDYRAKVILCRKAKEKRVPVVHTAGAGFRGSVTVFLPENITYEEMFRLPSVGRNLKSVHDREFLTHRRYVASIIGRGMYPDEIINRMDDPCQPWYTAAVAPMVAGVLAAMEAIKIVIGQKSRIIAAPNILQIDVLNNIYEIFEFGKEKITAYW